MKTLVVGATGFIGQHLVSRLLAEGHAVHALVRKPDAAKELSSAGVKLFKGDVLDRDSISRAAKGVEVVYNLAGASDSLLARSDPFGDRIFEANSLGNLHAVQAGLKAGVRRVVSVSSVFIFGHHPGKPVDEEHAVNLWHYAGPYLLSRLQQELFLLRHAGRGIEVIIVNPGFIVGAKDRGPNFPGQVVLTYLKRRVPAHPPGGTSWIGVTDVADGLLNAATRGRSGERYIFTSEDLTFKALGQRIETITGVPSPKRTLPKSMLKGGATLAGFGSKLIGRKPAIDPAVIIRLVTDGFYYSADKAAKDLGLPRRPIDDDLRAACEDFRSRGLCKWG